MSKYVTALKIINAITGVFEQTTGGSTGCNHKGCNCRIKNEDYLPAFQESINIIWMLKIETI